MADDNNACNSTASSAQIALLAIYTREPWKRSELIFVCNLVKNQRILMQFHS